MRGISLWIIVSILVFSPLPFGSVGTVWSQLYGVLIGIGLIVYVIDRWRAGRTIPGVPMLLAVAAALVALVALWGYAQATPGLLPSLQHPFWAQTAALLQAPDMKGYLSLTPEKSSQIATRYLTYLGFALLVLWHSRRHRNGELLLKIFIAAQAAYALYGLTIYFSGLETILWFDKPASRGVVSSTFVNRNNYATYAGLGVLATFVLALRYLRRLLDEESTRCAKLRDLLETLTSYGWLLPLTLTVLIVAILLSGSRGGLAAVMIASAVVLGVWISRLGRGRARNLGLTLLVLLLGFLSVNFFLSGGYTADRFARLFDHVDGRFPVYSLTLSAIAERPWTGYGLGSFDAAFRAFRDESIPVLFSRAHNDYLELAMDVGWPAAIAMITAFILVLVAGWRASRSLKEYELALLSVAATVQIGVHSAVDFSMQMPAVVYAYLLVALVGLGQLQGRLHSAARSNQATQARSIADGDVRQSGTIP